MGALVPVQPVWRGLPHPGRSLENAGHGLTDQTATVLEFPTSNSRSSGLRGIKVPGPTGSEMNITISIDQNAVSLVLDGAERRPLGTGFSLIRPNWIVTAKHVVLEDGLSRAQLLIGPSNRQPSIPARLLYAHPQIDLAVLEIDKRLCDRPLYPAHHSLAGSRGLICAGFAPSKSTSEAGTVLVNHIPSFTVEVRERLNLKEELVVFDAPYSEGGHSGGPIFGEGGGVVGVIIQNYSENGTLRARGTSLAPLIEELHFHATDSI